MIHAFNNIFAACTKKYTAVTKGSFGWPWCTRASNSVLFMKDFLVLFVYVHVLTAAGSIAISEELLKLSMGYRN